MGQGHILDADTFALWRCDEMPAATILDAPDSSGNSRHAAAATTAEAGQIRPIGPAGQFVRYFDGTDDVFTRAQDAATTALLKTTALTVQAFIKWESGATRCIFAHASTGETSATNIQFRWVLRTTEQEIFWETGSGVDVLHTTSVAAVPPINTWCHVAVVKTATHLRFYVNGVFIEQVAYAGAQPTGGTSNLFRIGDQSPGSLSFRGAMKDLKISNKTYTDGEVATEAALLNTTFELPVDANTHVLYRLNENTHALLDSGPNALHLVPTVSTALLHGLEGLCGDGEDGGKSVYFNSARVESEVNAAALALNGVLKLPFTFECWVVLGVPWLSQRGLWVFGDPGSILAVDNFLSVDINANRTIRWWSEYDTDADDTRDTSYVLPHGRHHLAFRKKAGYGSPEVYDVDIFVDGVLEETIVGVRQYSNGTSGRFTIGAATGSSFQGQMDDIRISDVARSDAEILDSYNRGRGSALFVPIEEL